MRYGAGVLCLVLAIRFRFQGLSRFKHLVSKPVRVSSVRRPWTCAGPFVFEVHRRGDVNGNHVPCRGGFDTLRV